MFTLAHAPGGLGNAPTTSRSRSKVQRRSVVIHEAWNLLRGTGERGVASRVGPGSRRPTP